MDELVGVAASVPGQRHGRTSDCTCDGAVLLQEIKQQNQQLGYFCVLWTVGESYMLCIMSSFSWEMALLTQSWQPLASLRPYVSPE